MLKMKSSIVFLTMIMMVAAENSTDPANPSTPSPYILTPPPSTFNNNGTSNNATENLMHRTLENKDCNVSDADATCSTFYPMNSDNGFCGPNNQVQCFICDGSAQAETYCKAYCEQSGKKSKEHFCILDWRKCNNYYKRCCYCL